MEKDYNWKSHQYVARHGAWLFPLSILIAAFASFGFDRSVVTLNVIADILFAMAIVLMAVFCFLSCPRCEETFYWKGSKWPFCFRPNTKNCLHCGLPRWSLRSHDETVVVLDSDPKTQSTGK